MKCHFIQQKNFKHLFNTKDKAIEIQVLSCTILLWKRLYCSNGVKGIQTSACLNILHIVRWPSRRWICTIVRSPIILPNIKFKFKLYICHLHIKRNKHKFLICLSQRNEWMKLTSSNKPELFYQKNKVNRNMLLHCITHKEYGWCIDNYTNLCNIWMEWQLSWTVLL